MIAAGFSLPKYGADGSYGNETVQAVKALQRKPVLRWMEFMDRQPKRRSRPLKRKEKSSSSGKNHPTRCRPASIK
ncbi:hypothetical protein PO124_31040 [Bacillus licheniformis]|nr:hypothetical protein [Bacillus licheniformis]